MDHVTTEPVPNLLYDQEDIASYLSSKFCPVNLGESFHHGRYRVVHKLGWGGFATVWLAREERWVALKIADAKTTQRMDGHVRVCTAQIQALQDVLNIASDTFEHYGPDGTSFVCSVFGLLSPTVDAVVCDYHKGKKTLDRDMILRLATQLLQSVAKAHKAGIAHGDISGSNLVFEATKLQNLDEAEILDVVGHPEIAKIVRKDGLPLSPRLPSHIVGMVTWDGWIDEDEENVRLIDWDQAFDISKPPGRVHQPHDLKAPETIITGHVDHWGDLWQAGCTILSFLFAARPFQTLDDDDLLLEQMDNFVERLPCEWSKRITADRRIQDGQRTDSDQPSKLEARFREMITEPELQKLLPIIKGLMRVKLEDRISADEALRMLRSGE